MKQAAIVTGEASVTSKNISIVFLNVSVLLSLHGRDVTPLTPPYPPSPAIKEVIWDYSSHRQAAPGSDLWPITWADDDHLYTVWGDRRPQARFFRSQWRWLGCERRV